MAPLALLQGTHFGKYWFKVSESYFYNLIRRNQLLTSSMIRVGINCSNGLWDFYISRWKSVPSKILTLITVIVALALENAETVIFALYFLICVLRAKDELRMEYHRMEYHRMEYHRIVVCPNLELWNKLRYPLYQGWATLLASRATLETS